MDNKQQIDDFDWHDLVLKEAWELIDQELPNVTEDPQVEVPDFEQIDEALGWKNQVREADELDQAFGWQDKFRDVTAASPFGWEADHPDPRFEIDQAFDWQDAFREVTPPEGPDWDVIEESFKPFQPPVKPPSSLEFEDDELDKPDIGRPEKHGSFAEAVSKFADAVEDFVEVVKELKREQKEGPQKDGSFIPTLGRRKTMPAHVAENKTQANLSMPGALRALQRT